MQYVTPRGDFSRDMLVSTKLRSDHSSDQPEVELPLK